MSIKQWHEFKWCANSCKKIQVVQLHVILWIEKNGLFQEYLQINFRSVRKKTSSRFVSKFL